MNSKNCPNSSPVKKLGQLMIIKNLGKKKKELQQRLRRPIILITVLVAILPL